jgi:8-oxoguanine deaminase
LWAGPGRRAKHVVVGGQIVVRDGELVGRGEREIAGSLAGLLRVRPPR